MEALEATKIALLAVTTEPSKATKTEFKNSHLRQEKEARRVYRKAQPKSYMLLL